MATTNKRAAKKTKPKPQGLHPPRSYSALKKGFAAQAQEIREGAEQQAATSEILRMIAKAPGDLQAVLDALAECAARLCDAKDAQIFRVEDNGIRRVAAYGDLPIALEHTPYNRESPVGRAMIDQQIVHIPDLAAVVDTEFPVIRAYQQFIGHRTTLAVPLLAGSVADRCHSDPPSGSSPSSRMHRSNFWKPSPTRRSLPSKMPG